MTKLRTILLAEDNPNDVELTLTALNANKLANKVDVVSDGVEVLEYLRCQGKFSDREKSIPVVLLLDIKMPRMDGIDTLKAIKSDPEFRLLPVVMLTSSREEPDLKICYELGANAFVVKPVDFQEFFTSVKALGFFWGIINELPAEFKI